LKKTSRQVIEKQSHTFHGDCDDPSSTTGRYRQLHIIMSKVLQGDQIPRGTHVEDRMAWKMAPRPCWETCAFSIEQHLHLLDLLAATGFFEICIMCLLTFNGPGKLVV
jgi:hypothetical protein